jgi:hypothetical protein
MGLFGRQVVGIGKTGTSAAINADAQERALRLAL